MYCICKKLVILCLTVISFIACSGGISGPQKAARVSMAISIPNSLLNQRAALIGDSSTDGLISLKYFIRRITLYKDLTINDTGYDGSSSGSINLFSNSSKADYNTYHNDDAKQDTTNYIDIMDPVDVAKLNSSTSITADMAGEYNYISVDWYRPVKITASVNINGHTLATKDGVWDYTHYQTISDLTLDTTPEEAIISLDNGGTWFRFPEPLVISADDIESEAAYRVSLVFNPVSLIKGQIGGGAGTNMVSQFTLIDPTDDIGMTIPMLDLAAIAHKTTDVIMCENYIATYDETNDFDVRIGIYYIQSDPAKNIYGIELKPLINANSTAALGDLYKIFTVDQTGNVVVLNSWKSDISGQGPVVTNLTRGIDGTLQFEFDDIFSPCAYVYNGEVQIYP